MKESPILMRDENVVAIFANLKTQTRRTLKTQPSDGWTPHNYGEVHKMVDGQFLMRRGAPVVIGWGPSNSFGEEAYAFPYGQPGDHLWVRETFCLRNDSTKGIAYRAGWDSRILGDQKLFKFKSPIYMFREQSRLTLEIKSVRAEHLHQITEADILAEGVRIPYVKSEGGYRQLVQLTGKFLPCDYLECQPLKATESQWLRAHYAALWEKINGKGSWAKNPWVWVIFFKNLCNLDGPQSKYASKKRG